ncbi:MAG: beta-ketoacyl synthase N-terminal-like domain-containing protein [Vicinamibacterales bacterium]
MTSHLLVFSAETRERLAEQVRACPPDGLAGLAARLRRLPPGPWRLAIVAATPAEFEDRRARALAALERAGEAGFALAGAACAGYLPPGQRPPKAACLFPGFGVRQTNLVPDLVRVFPRVERWLDGLGIALGTWSPDDTPATRGASAGPPTMNLDAVLLADLAMWEVVGALGWQPDVVAGHSFGENAALVASGLVDAFPTLIEVLGELRGLADATPATGGALGMLALSAASRPVLDPLLAADPPRVWVALDNCPQQLVVWGETPELEALEQAIHARREVAFRLPGLERPVHTPRFPLAIDAIRPHYDRVPIGTPRVPVWSAAEVAPFPRDPGAARDMLAAQWRRPVRFRDLVTALHADGVRTFVEIGPADRLSGFVRDTLRGAGVTTIATNVEGRDTLAQLQFAVGQLFVRGYPVDLERLAGTRATTREAAASAVAAPAAAAESRPGALEDVVARAVAAVLAVPSIEPADYDRGFFDLGLGSIGCISLVAALEAGLGTPLAQTLPFDHPTIRALAGALAGASTGTVATRTAAPAAPIAIIGMACRFPGDSHTPEAFWRLLDAGGDAVTPVPAGRSSAAELDPTADAEVTRRGAHGAFLRDIRGFDAGFFGISPREATTLDPQQRLLLELAWEALEHAAIDPRALTGTPAGVFVGISHADYAARFSPVERMAIGGYLATGNTASTAAGRLSFVLGLRGPSLAVDTACSSSLAALHLACESLRRGESSLALAGGVNLLVSAESTVFLARALALSPTGRCRTFDAAADGYVRGEGGGLLVLKPLDAARRDGDHVHAVIRGSAMNHDGRTSGLTVPNGPAQESVIRAALADAGVSPDDIGYVEAHGTGTALGDPIEVNALARVFGGRRGAPLRLGSVKTNIGHLEAAAGVAGVIKAVLQLGARTLVPTLHFNAPNPRADWGALGAPVVTAREDWPSAAPRLAGVSSFGISGTNVHVVLEEAEPAGPDESGRGVEVLPVSAATPTALAAAARRLATHLRHARPAMAAVSRTLALGRAHFDCRLAVVAATPDEAAEALERAAARIAPPRRPAPRIAWLFTGQGAQTAGMGRGLYEREPVFRSAVDRLDASFEPLLGGSVAEVMFDADAARLDQTGWAQPALFTLECALAALWRHWGLEPSIVAGHSVGEFAAAVVAGVLELDDAVRLVAARARLMQAVPADGAMLAADLDVAALRRIPDLPRAIDLAAVNAPAKIVLSGPTRAIERARTILAREGIRTTRLPTSNAFHSSLMDPAASRLESEAAAIGRRTPMVPLVSTLTGALADADFAAPGYWARQLRETVQFAPAVETIVRSGATVALELGPRPVLSTLAAISAAGALDAVPSLAPPADEARCLATALARMYEAGAPVRWDRVHEGATAPRLVLPTYPFERETYWIDRQPVASVTGPAPMEPRAATHPPAAGVGGGPTFAERLATADSAGRARLLTALVSAVAGAVLGVPADRALETDRPLTAVGLDSLMALQVSAIVRRESGLLLPAARIVDGSSIGALVEWLVARGAEEAPAASAGTRSGFVDGEL